MINFNPDFDVNSLSNRDKLRGFLKESWNETYLERLGYNVTSEMIKKLSDENLGELLPYDEGKIIVAMEGDSIVASCMHASRNNTTYIWGLYVLQTVQLSGIGRNMIEIIINEENKNILQVIVLEMSEGAVWFYERLGFRRAGTEEFELIPGYKESALIMKMKADDYLR